MKLITRLKYFDIPEFEDDAYKSAIRSLSKGLLPDPNLNFREFSDTHCYIPRSTGAANPGRYSSDWTPHVKVIMDCLDVAHPCRRVVLKVSSQMFKTQLALNWLTYIIALHPSNIILLQPTSTLHKRVVNRINKVIKATPIVKDLFSNPNSKTDPNNQSIKNFQNGALFIGSAGSASNLAELPARYAICDEVSRYPQDVQGEGNVIKLVEGRQTTYPDAKSYYFSSPTTKGECQITELYERGTKREGLFECVHCGHAQPLIFEELKTDEQGKCYYPCKECGGIHYEADKPEMFKNGLFTEAKLSDGETESFTLSTMFAPYGSFSWNKLYLEYLEAKDKMESQGDNTLMKSFYNIRLAREWTEETNLTTAEKLQERADDYPLQIVPHQCTFLTAAVDTQINRFEVAVYAWKDGIEGWIVDYQVIHGSPDEDDTKQKLLDYLTKDFEHACGRKLKLSHTYIDSGGSHTTDVYDFCRRNKKHKIYPIKGSSTPTAPIIPNKPKTMQYTYRGRPDSQGVKLFVLGTHEAKNFIFSRISKNSGYGVIHFSKELPVEFFKGIISEYLTKKTHRGQQVTAWVKKNGIANEPLDLLVYNLCAAFYLRFDQVNEAYFNSYRKKLKLDDLVEVAEKPAKKSKNKVEDAEIIESEVREDINTNVDELSSRNINTNSRHSTTRQRIKRRNPNFNIRF